ncbi:hypothetical protein [Actinocrispum sp. NPDC049592]
MLRNVEFDVDIDPAILFARAAEVWRCSVCERLWVFWTPDGEPVEYLKR